MEDLIIQYLNVGFAPPLIAKYMRVSLSTVEKELKKIRAKYKAKTMFHLAYILNTKDIAPDFSGACNDILIMEDSPEI